METATPSRVWFITGCSSGFGLALAEAALAQGDRVVATARQPDTSEPLGALALRYPETCRAVALDVTNPSQVRSALAAGVEAFGGIDVVVNNAGYGLVGAFEELSKEQIERNFQTNFFGALDVIRAALPILRTRPGSRIVNLSAAAAIANYAGFSIYGATKFALEGVSESLAAELKPFGIAVILVQPGPFRTDFISRSLERAATAIPGYERTSGKFLAFLNSMEGLQPGDPALAAQAILAAVASERPPLRLVLGKYANDKVRKKAADLERERAAWEAIGQPTDFPA
jgi:NAD(P)-dependent dehydrogenase (short-subunit alcohol dehydrogenase family)